MKFGDEKRKREEALERVGGVNVSAAVCVVGRQEVACYSALFQPPSLSRSRLFLHLFSHYFPFYFFLITLFRVLISLSPSESPVIFSTSPRARKVCMRLLRLLVPLFEHRPFPQRAKEG